jgi:hypothetical protein
LVQNSKKTSTKEEKFLLQQNRIKALCLYYQYFMVIAKLLIYIKKTFNEIITKKKVYLIMKEKDICCRLRIKKINIIIAII